MLVLALDTATHDLVTGLVDTESGVATDRVLPATRGHNELLMPTVTELLDASGHAFADLDAVVVGHGPGPFTGLRVGMATASAIAQARGIPVFGVSSLDAIAARHEAKNLLVATDARRREVYWAHYVDGVRVSGPSVDQPGNLPDNIEVDAVVVPEHLVDKLPAHLAAVPHVELTPRAAGLVSCADLSAAPEPLTPAYLRRPDAVPPTPAPRSAAIPEVRP